MLQCVRTIFTEGRCPIELEQMGSADPPLAVHGIYGSRHRQHCGRGYTEVCQLGGPPGGGTTRPTLFLRPVLVCAAVCHQVAQRATHRLSGQPHDDRPRAHCYRSQSRGHEGFSSYLQSTRLSCEAMICHVPPRFSQVSVQTWHTFTFGWDFSLPTACSRP